MRLIDALARLKALQTPIITVNDAASAWAVTRPHAAKILARLGEARHVVRLRHGLWAFPDRIEPFMLPEHLAAPSPAYISLHSALHYHGWIMQIPTVIYAVTLRRASRIVTPVGVVSFHRVGPDFFFGFELYGPQGIKVAHPEKALLDIFYLDSGRSAGWRGLPELEPPNDPDFQLMRAMSARISSPIRRRAVLARIEKLEQELRKKRIDV